MCLYSWLYGIWFFFQGFRLEAYWDSSYVIPPERSCYNQSLEVYEKPIDIWRHVPKDLRNSNLTINIAFADFDLDRCGLDTI